MPEEGGLAFTPWQCEVEIPQEAVTTDGEATCIEVGIAIPAEALKAVSSSADTESHLCLDLKLTGPGYRYFQSFQQIPYFDDSKGESLVPLASGGSRPTT
jgi:hypothetical protein